MKLYCYLDSNGTIWVGNGVERTALTDMSQFSQRVFLGNSGGAPLVISANGRVVHELSDVATVGDETIAALGAIR